MTSSAPVANGFAAEVKLPRLTPKEAAIAARSIARVLADSNRTLDIVVGEEIASQAQLRYLLERLMRATPEGRALLRDRPELRDVDMDALRALPDGTLGRELARYLDANGFDYDVDAAVPSYTRDPDAAYLMRRIRKNHDLWHVLLGLGPAGHEEVLVHAFTLAQVGLPSSVAIVGFGAIKHMVLEGRWQCLSRSVREAYERGRRAAPLVTVRWEDQFAEPLDAVRARFGVVPMRAA